MNYLKILIFILFCSSYCAAQDTAVYLQSLRKPKKVYKIQEGDDVQIEIAYKDSLGKSMVANYAGSLQRINGSDLVLSIGYIMHEHEFPNGMKLNIDSTYNGIFDGGYLRSFNVNAINSISRDKTGAASLAGGAVAGIGLFTAIFVAPLIAVNFKTGDFRQERYYKTLAVCGGGIVLGFAFQIGFDRSRMFPIKNVPPNDPDMDYYSIQVR